MKQIVEEAAMKELNSNSSNAIIYDGELVYQRQGMLNMFKKGTEWHAKQSPWISIEEKEPRTNEPILAMLEGYPVIMILCGWDNRLGYHPNITHWMPIPKFNK